MFKKGVTLFKLFNFEVRLDSSWIFIVILVTWSLASNLFPYYYRGFSLLTYWIMGLIGALGLFISIVFHELCHSLVARKFGLSIKGITLFIFGGVAEMEEEPQSAKTEFFMALAGPLSSVILGVFFGLTYFFMFQFGVSYSIIGVLRYLSWINFILAGFNLLPAFPLDGGRLFRSALWRWKGNLKWATRISSKLGSGFGLGLVFLGIFYILAGVFITGFWYFLIGIFLRDAAKISYKRLLLRQALEGEQVRRFMNPAPSAIPLSISIAEFVENYVYKHHFKLFPVVKEEKLIGYVSTRQVKNIPREEWTQHKIEEILTPYSSKNTISPDADATRALSIMNKTGNSRLLVLEKGRLVGIISLKDMLRFLSIKLDLEGEDDRTPNFL